MKVTSVNRRSFLRQSSLGALAGVSMPGIIDLEESQSTCEAQKDNMVIVFQGDSITDARREKEKQLPNHTSSLGNGYVALAAAELLREHAGKNWSCYNRGISGNKVFQLAERWKEDCLDLKPDVLSILIGVNDFWHTLTHDYKGTATVYEQDFRNLLDLTLSNLPDVKIIIGEPFSVYGGTAIDSSKWYPAFDAYRAAAKRVAKDFDAVWVPYQTLFDEALQKADVEYWCPDGVHPSIAGNALMAQAWLDGLNKALN